jgi:predicted GTPase
VRAEARALLGTVNVLLLGETLVGKQSRLNKLIIGSRLAYSICNCSVGFTAEPLLQSWDDVNAPKSSIEQAFHTAYF